MLDKDFWSLVISRLFDLVKICVGVSLCIAVVLYFGIYFDILPDNAVINTAFSTVGFIIFIIFQIKYSKQCRTASGSAKIYFPVSAIAYFVFALLGLAVYLIFGLFWYSWPFVITKFLHFVGLPNVISVLIFHIITLGIISVCAIENKPEATDEK